MKGRSKALQVGLILFGLVCFGVAGIVIKTFSGRWVDDDGPTAVAGPALSSPKNTELKVEEPEIWVLYVTGGVKSPGVYRLPPDSRVFHLVDSAGGLASDADETGINMAAPLVDGEHVHVPLRPSLVRDTAQLPSGQPQGGYKVSTLPPPSGSGTGRSGTVDLNRGSLHDLQTLPGIGPKTAQAIVSYREDVGPFKSVDDLIKVKGIGTKKLDSIRSMVTVR
ncbi:ComEA family DNA-binding protein [Dethiosulfovibrio salsuginis]|uniref:Competence protein ComEA n=1 Tax=Dethiosulfovibrio salsuginis TaxID=561720 RepID=A0A1X7JGJ3_9BACT|nr:ComEA family DNA-binding protein [Dethiosulfovibrio salsuginis]SMG27155.1 competence protein ComEA [Dethiosulfovibrio salsuginis]